jgi:hypothetical protein
MKKSILAVAMTLFLAGCASTSIDQYRVERPVLDLKTYLNGTLDAWGLFQGRSGEVKKRFHVVIDAKWTGDVGVLDEHFKWSDGTSSRRVWTLTRQPDGTFRGRADDVVGEAIGEVAGNALRWRYVLALPLDGSVYHVDFDDWMFLLDEKVMMNRSYMSKWGFDLGEVTLTFVKR